MAFLSGCIVADPPQYQDAERTPPLLDTWGAIPSPLSIIVLDHSTTTKLEVSVPVRSEDQGDSLFAALHLDYTYPSHRLIAQDENPRVDHRRCHSLDSLRRHHAARRERWLPHLVAAGRAPQQLVGERLCACSGRRPRPSHCRVVDERQSSAR
ncbi:MAG: hypothetical protein QM756_25820 [Polyangiaceae bacterium]